MAAIAATLAMAASWPSHAQQNYPAKPIRMLVPFSAGSLTDVLARMLELPDVKERILAGGASPKSSTPEQFDAFNRAEIEKLGKVIRASRARIT